MVNRQNEGRTGCDLTINVFPPNPHSAHRIRKVREYEISISIISIKPWSFFCEGN